MLLFGGLIVGGFAGGGLTTLFTSPDAEIDQVDAADLDAAKLSFPPAEIGTHIEDAKACRVPISFVTLVPRNGSTGHVRIHSGDYWTPVIHLGMHPLRVALPFPAPYATGRGVLQVEGDGAAFDMYIRPGSVGGTLQGVATVPVWWKVKTAC